MAAFAALLAVTKDSLNKSDEVYQLNPVYITDRAVWIEHRMIARPQLHIHNMAQTFVCLPLAAEFRAPSQVSQRGICGQ